MFWRRTLISALCCCRCGWNTPGPGSVRPLPWFSCDSKARISDLALNWISSSFLLYLYYCQATLTHSPSCPDIKLRRVIARGESDAHILRGFDADVEVKARCQAEWTAGPSMDMILIVQPAPLLPQISRVTAVGASPQSHIHPNKEKQLLSSSSLGAFHCLSQTVFVCCHLSE